MSDSWRPTANLSRIKARDELYKKIRSFFSEKKYLEVDVPLLGSGGTTDRFIQSFYTQSENKRFYLQTSPEFAMKRLLAAGSGPIYSLSKAFRQEEIGRFHNSEFTMLEWYRPGFDDHQLMDEVLELMNCFFDVDMSKISYQRIFEKFLFIDPHRDSIDKIKSKITELLDVNDIGDETDKDVLLDILFSHLIQPKLKGKLFFIYDYPETQSALARIKNNNEGVSIARRFELFVDGIELANGYWELANSTELRQRFEDDNSKRETLGLEVMNYDEHLIQAMDSGLPDCAGVALGVDRLLMLIEGAEKIEEVIVFPFDRS
ncbi:MAG: EF-P lysine aminoacylase EpmA [Cellvibrionaceae bacterium]